ncbi:ATP-binding protein [Pedobacter xixiisoli]|uniref:Adenylate kinase n=1 Tax=Pedobacter xixiisoli TaxID=1476464 RepID=A0A286ACZ4_9SPHI|nr:ATP-binding protein [Pedobacter xixiisoli]SOD19768.1 adenylate kinase [Pedobacter xixiisoli]
MNNNTLNEQTPRFNNIIFVGGIHGVGKSTLCKQLCLDFNLEYLSASELIKWSEINSDAKNKKVRDIPSTQNRLINGLIENVEVDGNYILDGHYCLLNAEGIASNVPLSLFSAINPRLFCLVTGNVTEIQKGLEERDQRPYDADFLLSMQNQEVEYASFLSNELGKNLIVGNRDGLKKFKDGITSLMR